MTAEHSVVVAVPAGTTTATMRDLLAYVDQHAPPTATLAAEAGKLTATWDVDTAAPPTRNTGARVGFGPERHHAFGFAGEVRA